MDSVFPVLALSIWNSLPSESLVASSLSRFWQRWSFSSWLTFLVVQVRLPICSFCFYLLVWNIFLMGDGSFELWLLPCILLLRRWLLSFAVSCSEGLSARHKYFK